MSRLKKITVLILLQLITNYGIAQNNDIIKDDSLKVKYTVSVEIDKTEFSIAENIYIRFKIDFKEDSLQYAQYDVFERIVGPNITVSSSYNAGKMTQIKSIFYILKPKISGEYIIESPIFFVNGKEVKDSVKITVSNTRYRVAQSSGLLRNTWVGENNEYLNISKQKAHLQKGDWYQQFEVAQYVKKRYIILSGSYNGLKFEQKYNIVHFTQDTLILAPEKETFFTLGQTNNQNCYVFVNSILTYKFEQLYYETSLDYLNAKLKITLVIDSSRNSKVTVKEEYLNENKVYKSPISKKDYERLLKILSTCDIASIPIAENTETNSNDQRYSILEIRYNGNIKTYKGYIRIPFYYAKLSGFIWEYIKLLSGVEASIMVGF